MVTIVSRYNAGFTGSGCKIPGGPLYKNDILDVINSAKIVVGTRKCKKDLMALSKDEEDLRGIIENAVENGRFHQSEWCELSSPNTWAACDSYKWIENCWVEAANKEMDCHFYIKFCIGKAGNVVITVSYHTS